MQHLYFFGFLLIMVLATLVVNYLHSLATGIKGELSNPGFDDSLSDLSGLKTILQIGIPTLVLGYGIYIWVDELGWNAHVLDWLQLLVRWFHITIGIAWIGASFYFIFLENALNRTDGLRDELAGNLWAVHGGGFYYLEKFKSAPGQMPKMLHWFKYEAYFTWISGICLLVLVYYFNADAYMVDPSVSPISSQTGVAIGLGSLLIGWLIYDGLCRTSLLQQKKAFALIGFCIILLITWFLTSFLSGRAAFMHVGALLGTIMAGNVFFSIIPSQKALVNAAKIGKPVNPELGKIAGLRSLHNNYMTLPVLFVMISNHYPITYSGPNNWLIMGLLILGSVAVRHFINLHEKGIVLKWMLPLAAVIIIGLIVFTAPKSRNANLEPGEKIQFAQVEGIFKERCQSCHSSKPTDDVFKVAPSGVLFETYDQIASKKDKILNRVVETKTMPQGNKTGMLDEERELISAWIDGGMQP
ncbi:MAG TPA: urate hydroxylase PuuD [Catalimonadaceae bacterium]|nr:urate hydroxylase PuuD [Catalimonadaceae bacterium]